MRKIVTLTACLLCLVANLALAKTVEERLKEVEKRLQKVEVKAGTDRVRFVGDFRFEVHNIQTSIPDHVDGMLFQSQFVDALAYLSSGGAPPMTVGDIPTFMGEMQNYIAGNFGDYIKHRCRSPQCTDILVHRAREGCFRLIIPLQLPQDAPATIVPVSMAVVNIYRFVNRAQRLIPSSVRIIFAGTVELNLPAPTLKIAQPGTVLVFEWRAVPQV